ncbi:MAG: hypothetical protein GY867_12590, partial [bacterium]|nr:hypothetical protein [bacterium]
MKRLICLVLLALTATSCTTSRRISFLEMPPVPEAYEPVDIAALEEKYGNHDGVYLDYQVVMEHAGAKKEFPGSRGSYTKIVKRKYVVFDTEASWLTSKRLFRKPEVMYIRISRPDGSVTDYGLEDLKEIRSESGSKFWT